MSDSSSKSNTQRKMEESNLCALRRPRFSKPVSLHRDVTFQVGQRGVLSPCHESNVCTLPSSRGDRNRTCDSEHPKLALYQSELHPDSRRQELSKTFALAPTTRIESVLGDSNPTRDLW